MSGDEREYVDISEALARVPFSRRTLERLISTGVLPVHRLGPGGKRLLKIADLDTLILSGAERHAPRDRWFLTLQAAASEASDEPLDPAELEELAAHTRKRRELDELLVPYPPDIAALCDSMLGLLDHWRDGTATPIEVSSLYWFIGPGFIRLPSGPEVIARYGSEDDAEDRAAVQEHWLDVLARMARDVVGS